MDVDFSSTASELEGIFSEDWRLWEGCGWVIPAANLHKPENVAWKRDSKDRLVELTELKPGVAGVLVFNLSENTDLSLVVNKQRIGLAPPPPITVCEFDPGVLPILAFFDASAQLRKVSMRLALIPQPDCESSTSLLSPDERWGSWQELRAPDIHRGYESLRWLARGLHRSLSPERPGLGIDGRP